jgi:ankyrin repeat protein
MKHIKSLFFSFLLVSGAASAMNPAPELSQAEREELGMQLLDAIAQHEQERATQLIAAGADLNVADQYGNTPLHLVCKYSRNEAIFQQLIAAGADVNVADQLGDTPLTNICIYLKKEAIFQQLIAAGANVNITTLSHNTPLFYACHYWNNQDIAAQLADLMLRTPTAEQYHRVRTFLWCLKRLGFPLDMRYVFKEPLLCMIAQENAENPKSLFRKQINKLDDYRIKQYLLDKYVLKKTTGNTLNLYAFHSF